VNSIGSQVGGEKQDYQDAHGTPLANPIRPSAIKSKVKKRKRKGAMKSRRVVRMQMMLMGHASLFLHVIFGSVATSALLVAGVEPVLASSGVTVFYLLVASVLRFKRQQPAAVFCGTFAGMTSIFVFFNRAPFSLGFSRLIYLCIAIVTGSLYVLIMYFEHKLPKRLFSGYGGRLGAIAFIGSVSCLMITGLLIRLISGDFQVVVLKDSAAFSEKAPLAMILASALGSFLTRVLAKNLNSTIPGLNVVLSASVCGFVGGIIFLFLPTWGPMASLYWYAGNFAGMSSTSILDSHARILLAGAITGVFLARLHYYGSGVGGLLGFSAFLAVIVLKCFLRYAHPEGIDGFYEIHDGDGKSLALTR